MRMSRLLGLLSSGGAMNPPSVTTYGGLLNYATPASATSDKWHMTEPYSNDMAYFGRNINNYYHTTAIYFTTGSYTGKSKNFSVSIKTSQSGVYAGVPAHWQLCTSDANKNLYVTLSTNTPPTDSTAICNGTVTAPYTATTATMTISGEAKLSPNTQYVLYVWGTSDSKYSLVNVYNSSASNMSVTVTE